MSIETEELKLHTKKTVPFLALKEKEIDFLKGNFFSEGVIEYHQSCMSQSRGYHDLRKKYYLNSNDGKVLEIFLEECFPYHKTIYNGMYIFIEKNDCTIYVNRKGRTKKKNIKENECAELKKKAVLSLTKSWDIPLVEVTTTGEYAFSIFITNRENIFEYVGTNKYNEQIKSSCSKESQDYMKCDDYIILDELQRFLQTQSF